MSKLGFGKATALDSVDATLDQNMHDLDPAYWAIRGREQQLIDSYGGSWSDNGESVGRGETNSGNAKRGVAKRTRWVRSTGRPLICSSDRCGRIRATDLVRGPAGALKAAGGARLVIGRLGREGAN